MIMEQKFDEQLFPWVFISHHKDKAIQHQKLFLISIESLRWKKIYDIHCVHCIGRYENRSKSSFSKQVSPGSRSEAHKHKILYRLEVVSKKSKLCEKVSMFWRCSMDLLFPILMGDFKNNSNGNGSIQSSYSGTKKNNCLFCASVEKSWFTCEAIGPTVVVVSVTRKVTEIQLLEFKL